MDQRQVNYVNSVKNRTSKQLEKPTFEMIQPLLLFYHEQLLNMAINHISTDDIYAFEGGMSSINGVSNNSTEMLKKMKNIYYLAQECEGDVLEVGFNSGNSAIIFLLANPNLHIYAYDLCCHSYVKPCVDYLNSLFNNRITLIKGNSKDTLKNIIYTNIQIYHIDGCHNADVVESDMKNVYDVAKDGSYLILDDTDQRVILNEYYKYISSGKICDCKLKFECNKYKHSIGKYIKCKN